MIPRDNRAWSATQLGTDAGATATKAAKTGVAWIITEVSGHTDKDCLIQVLDGSTVLAQWSHDVSVQGFGFGPFVGLWPCTGGASAAGKISTSTADCQVNVCGFGIP